MEDDPDIRTLVASRLARSGEFQVEGFSTGEAFLKRCEEAVPDLVILDLSLPDTDGLTLCRELRAWDATKKMPILMLTARAGEADRVTGLALGADDYLVKPFALAELEARVRALLRRVNWERGISDQRFQGKHLTIDTACWSVTVDGRPVHLTRREFQLLWYLVSLRGRVASRQQILEAVWGLSSFVDERTVDAHIRALRKKLGPCTIETVTGVGYRFKESV